MRQLTAVLGRHFAEDAVLNFPNTQKTRALKELNNDDGLKDHQEMEFLYHTPSRNVCENTNSPLRRRRRRNTAEAHFQVFPPRGALLSSSMGRVQQEDQPSTRGSPKLIFRT